MGKHTYTELKDAKDYFPYIRHELEPETNFNRSLGQYMIGDLYKKENITRCENTLVINSEHCKTGFKKVNINGLDQSIRLAKDNSCVNTLVPRHRSLLDYTIHMPLHNLLVNPHVILLAGYNLFVGSYDLALRKHGAVAFIRKDTVMKRRGYPKVFLSVDRYLNEVYPAYIKQEMFDGQYEGYIKKDLIIYPGQEKNSKTGSRDGGRTKSGLLRKLNPVFFNKFRKLAAESPTRLYITPVNISLSYYPDAPYIVHPSSHKGLLKMLRYAREQHLVYRKYPWYSYKHTQSKIDAVVQYGEPIYFDPRQFNSIRDTIHFTMEIRNKIGLLESIFPVTLVCRAMDNQADMAVSALKQNIQSFLDCYAAKGINLSEVSDTKGNLLPAAQIIKTAVQILQAKVKYYISGVKTKQPLILKSGRLYCNDMNLLAWYGNNIRHLD